MREICGAWVRAMLDAVQALCPQENAAVRFGEPESGGGATGDYAVLRDHYASFFMETLGRYAAYAPVSMDRHRLQLRHVQPGGAPRYAHSCYARNLRRWMNGTLSRKHVCQTEFDVLCVCWALGWGGKYPTEAAATCRGAMIRACRAAYPDAPTENETQCDEALIRLIALTGGRLRRRPDKN